MGAQQSKDALLYEQVNYGNVEGIKTLRRQGAGLEVTHILIIFFRLYISFGIIGFLDRNFSCNFWQFMC